VVVAGDMLFGVMVKAVFGWLWHSDRIYSRKEYVLGDYLGNSIRRITKGMMGSMVGEMVATALCD
jgi:hypothetical protein